MKILKCENMASGTEHAQVQDCGHWEGEEGNGRGGGGKEQEKGQEGFLIGKYVTTE